MNHCPWSDWVPSELTFCEAPLCEWVRHPANTWSNLAYLFVGLYLLRLAYRKKDWLAAVFGGIACLVSVCSGLFHASGTYVGEVLDLWSMFLLSSLFMVFNLKRFFPMSFGTALLIYLLNVGLTLGLMVATHTSGVPIFIIQVTLAGILEIVLRFKRGPVDYRGLGLTALFFAVAYGIWWLDYLHIVCDPNLHWISGHALWHGINSFCFVFAYQFYSQFGFSRSKRQSPVGGGRL